MLASIEHIEEVIANYGRAAEANWKTPGRVGNMVEITSELADEVMITADLHGNRRNFVSIRRIAGLEKHPRRHLVLHEVCHGGPTYSGNGGCMSHGMLEDVAKWKADYPNQVHFLISNHELAELTDYPILKQKKMLNLLFRLGLQEAYGPAADKVREASFPFLRSCPLAVRLPGKIVVCHSAPANFDAKRFDMSIFDRPLGPEDYIEHGGLFNLVWGRDYRPENAAAFAKAMDAEVLIHGHEPCPEKGYQIPNDRQIILDCCGPKATYLMVPTDRTLSHGELVKRIAELK